MHTPAATQLARRLPTVPSFQLALALELELALELALALERAPQAALRRLEASGQLRGRYAVTGRERKRPSCAQRGSRFSKHVHSSRCLSVRVLRAGPKLCHPCRFLGVTAVQLSAVPPTLPCRSAERGKVSQFLESAIRKGGLGCALYISGGYSRQQARCAPSARTCTAMTLCLCCTCRSRNARHRQNCDRSSGHA